MIITSGAKVICLSAVLTRRKNINYQGVKDTCWARGTREGKSKSRREGK